MTNTLLHHMYRIRLIEQRIAQKFTEQKMRCPVHLSIGQEAGAVGVCSALSIKDKMVSTHRAHAHYLAKGGSLRGLIGELYGKACGCSKGNGGSMHLIDLSVNFWGSTSIVAQTIPVGVGLAFADKLQGRDNYTAVCFGDAAIEEGVFHEAANFAALHKLNVIFVCENNLYSCFTHISQRQPDRNFSEVAKAHGLRYVKTGTSVRDIHIKTRAARLQPAPGPSFIEIPTYRYLEHCGPHNDDHLNYRPEKEIALWKRLDQLKNYNSQAFPLLTQEIDRAFKEVEESPAPDPSDFGGFEYAPIKI